MQPFINMQWVSLCYITQKLKIKFYNCQEAFLEVNFLLLDSQILKMFIDLLRSLIVKNLL